MDKKKRTSSDLYDSDTNTKKLRKLTTRSSKCIIRKSLSPIRLTNGSTNRFNKLTNHSSDDSDQFTNNSSINTTTKKGKSVLSLESSSDNESSIITITKNSQTIKTNGYSTINKSFYW